MSIKKATHYFVWRERNWIVQPTALKRVLVDSASIPQINPSEDHHYIHDILRDGGSQKVWLPAQLIWVRKVLNMPKLVVFKCNEDEKAQKVGQPACAK